MRGLSITALLLGVASTSLALPPTPPPPHGGPTLPCRVPIVRRSWHSLSLLERKAYLDAELCLMRQPATLGLRGARTRFDEFQSVHTLQAEIAHWVGQFFPFHRLFVYGHEHQLRTKCGYRGAQPYWDETIDAANFSQSILLDPVYGFGGDGAGDSQCITTGPFANYKNSIGPGYTIASHCIQRAISQGGIFSIGSLPLNVNPCLSFTTFRDFANCVEAGPHGAGHGGIGAEMLNAVSSPGDPFFFLHHAWLDRLWAKWQDQDRAHRLTDISGPNRINLTSPFPLGGPFVLLGSNLTFQLPIPPYNGTNKDDVIRAILGASRPPDVPEPQVIGDPGDQVTLNHVLQLYGIVPNMTVQQVMETKQNLCYVYD